MKNPASLLLLSLLLAVSTAAPAKGAKFRGGGTSHAPEATHAPAAHGQAESGSGGSVHLPTPRIRSGSESTAADNAAQQAAATSDKLSDELAALRATTPPAAPVGALVANPPAAPATPLAPNERRLNQPVAVEKPVELAPMKPVDLSALVPKDSNQVFPDDVRRDDRFNARGVNCSRYPARCH